ncbi:hypothetical protein [Nitratireductor rhodophyticola]|uniref:hypothetical protein n=1 Tax=Nitratireductor rhodophyticola TaxID=2854036 RepID=UPI003008E25E
MNINTLWIGGNLGAIEILSAQSFLEAGHDVVLYSFEEIKNAPTGVKNVDAEQIIRREDADKLRYRKTGSYALASDYFRFLLQRKGRGAWADLDMVCLKPVSFEKDIVFGRESAVYINGALLYAKPDHPVIEGALSFFAKDIIPPWTRRRDANRLRLKSWLLGKTIEPATLPWGTFGPKAITYLARKHDAFDMAEPEDVFYPIHFKDAPYLYDPSRSFEEFCTERTRTVHLWNEVLRSAGLKDARPPIGSPLAKLMNRFGV